METLSLPACADCTNACCDDSASMDAAMDIIMESLLTGNVPLESLRTALKTTKDGFVKAACERCRPAVAEANDKLKFMAETLWTAQHVKGVLLN